jgi:hypothetical protein
MRWIEAFCYERAGVVRRALATAIGHHLGLPLNRMAPNVRETAYWVEAVFETPAHRIYNPSLHPQLSKSPVQCDRLPGRDGNFYPGGFNATTTATGVSGPLFRGRAQVIAIKWR